MDKKQYRFLSDEQKILAQKLRPSDYKNRVYEVSDTDKIISSRKKKYIFLVIRIKRTKAEIRAYDELKQAESDLKRYNAVFPNIRLLSRAEATRSFGADAVKNAVTTFERSLDTIKMQ